LKYRIFFALNIPEKSKQELIQNRNNVIPNSNKYKWEPKDKLHLTLKFIGEVEDDLFNKVLGKEDLFKNFNSFECCINQFGFFYKNKEPRILWANIKSDYLNKLAQNLDEKLSILSIQKEKRPFVPHLTLLRIKNKINEDFVKSFENYKFEEIKFIASEISLIESKLLPYGSVYTEIKKYILGESK